MANYPMSLEELPGRVLLVEGQLLREGLLLQEDPRQQEGVPAVLGAVLDQTQLRCLHVAFFVLGLQT